jgi:excisionase family DNA binding protein
MIRSLNCSVARRVRKMPRLKKKYIQPISVPVPAPAPAVTPEYLDVEQAAVYLSATITSARRWLKKQKLRSLKIGKRFTYKRADIDSAWKHAAASV